MADKEFLERLIRIDNRTDSMQHSLAWLVRANEPELKKALIEAFGKSKVRAQVYVAVNGKKNVNQLAGVLSMKQPNVSRELAWLKKKGLIESVGANGAGTVYKRSPFDSIVYLAEELARLFQLDKEGRPIKKK